MSLENKSITTKRSAATIKNEDDDKVSVTKSSSGLPPKGRKVEE